MIQGKAEIGRRNWSAAKEAFRQLIDRYPKSLEAKKAHFKLAELAEFGGELAEAARRYRDLAEAPNPMRAAAAERLRLLDR
jgi:TolA-binding protein